MGWEPALRGKYIKGTEQVVKNMNLALSKIEGATVEGMKLAMPVLVQKSQELCPVDTGMLKSSHKFKVTTTKNKIKGTVIVDATIAERKTMQMLNSERGAQALSMEMIPISASDKTTSYALLVHETHKTKSKFLQNAAFETQDQMQEILKQNASKVTSVKKIGT